MFKKYNYDVVLTIIMLTVLVGILLYFKFNGTEHTGEEYTPLHEQWFPNSNDTTQKQHNFQVGELTAQDSLELKEPDAIYYDTSNTDNMLDIDMNCGDNESIPKYSRFTDVPAGVEDKIIVDDILYKMNDNKTKWIPVYPDEYIMWIGSNGDTIWE